MALLQTWLPDLTPHQKNLYIALSAPLLGLTTLHLLTTLLTPQTRTPQSQPNILLAPSSTPPAPIAAAPAPETPYPASALPGARDIPTPYGRIRAYEWGPKTGRRVLFVHGISTPCPALAPMAQRLVAEQGCRVMLFDLFGRGYSDAPDPRVYAQDLALFSSQIMFVLGSSELDWTGAGGSSSGGGIGSGNGSQERERFTLIGYSLGGGIAAGFASWFPRLVGSLVLVAPSGLLRPYHISAASKLLYQGWLPESVIEFFIRRRLRGPGHPAGGKNERGTSETPGVAVDDAKIEPEDAVVAEGAASNGKPIHPANAANSSALIQIDPSRPGIAISSLVAWQLSAHKGFLTSFISSIRHAPILEQHERYGVIGRNQEKARSSSASEGEKAEGLDEGKVLVLLGKDDGVIVADELEPDVKGAVGEANVRVVRLEGAHDVPVVNSEGCVRALVEFWGEKV